MSMDEAEEKKYTYSVDGYFSYEDEIEGRAEYYKGMVCEMAGGSETHSLIASNVTIELGTRIKGSRNRLYNGDLKIAIKSYDSFVYADCMVICGPPQKYEGRNDAITNPVLVVEVLSPSTALHDRTHKFSFYRTIESLQEYVLIEQNEFLVDVYSLNSDGNWLFASYSGKDSVVKLHSLGLDLLVSEIYANVDFELREIGNSTERPMIKY